MSAPSSMVKAPAAEDVAGLDVARIRVDFPILTRSVHGRRLVYLDNAATTQKPFWDPPWDPVEMASDEIKDQLGIW